ncbi:reverse transcriptase-like protein [Elysia marginata]|uniref:Reverse transcriptase-like protein n=1 Tax=Elysia marginata TaxID=1093978 RepID=A0AAV4I4C4_9GAST|nr:reverse transcriptase-like protein [Elysia marginata]
MQNFDPWILPSDRNCIIASDFKAHSKLWDPYQPANPVGEKLELWVEENHMVVMNDSQATRMNPSSGGPLTPDKTFTRPTLAPSTTSTVTSDSMGSDHNPILIAIELKSPKPTPHHRKRFSFKKANWDLFQNEVAVLLSKKHPSPPSQCTL